MKHFDILVDVLKRRCPVLVGDVLNHLEQLDTTQRKTIIMALADELAACGVDANFEPNAKGLQLEVLIDAVNREILKR